MDDRKPGRSEPHKDSAPQLDSEWAADSGSAGIGEWSSDAVAIPVLDAGRDPATPADAIPLRLPDTLPGSAPIPTSIATDVITTPVPIARATSPAAALLARLGKFELAIAIFLCSLLLIPGIWSYTLIDPWETHYAEVARRMLDDSDWVLLRWQNEIFQSKPVLTFWLIAGGMKAMGVGHLGGYSGELATSPLTVLAVRLPFVLFGIGGMVSVWWMLARLVNRRVAWLSLLVIGTTPFYYLVSRQAITDIPMVACLMGSIAYLAMAIHAEDEPLTPFWRKLNAYHVFIALLVLFVGGQLLYYGFYFFFNPKLAVGVRIGKPFLLVTAPFLALLGLFVAWSWMLPPTRTKRSVYMYWFYALVGVSVLGKGPPAIGLAGVICFFYLLITRQWRLLPAKLELFRGMLIVALVSVPWHVAMWLKAGPRWAQEYFVHHMYKRAFLGKGGGVHGDSGTFDYYASQLGPGMWPWIALLPAAIATAIAAARIDSREGRVRLLVGIWAITGFTLFAASATKFHHYVLPAVPALGILIAFWLDDILAGRAQRIALVSLLGAGIAAFVARDFIAEQKQLIELYIYRYDRPWPSNAPWNVDLSDTLFAFGVAITAAIAALAWRRTRVWVVGALTIATISFSVWAMNGYMVAAAPHWGQRELHRTYYRLRQIHGVDLAYSGLRELAEDWAKGEYKVETVLPETFPIGAPMKATITLPNAGLPKDTIVLEGKVTRVGHDAFWMTGAPPAELAAKWSELIERGRKAPSGRRPWIQVNADRLLAWQLNWRGENFWSSGEIWGETKDTQTVFIHTDNKAFLEYIKDPTRAGRKFFVITEAGRAEGLKGILPTPTAKKTFEILDRSCNKFTLLSFTL